MGIPKERPVEIEALRAARYWSAALRRRQCGLAGGLLDTLGDLGHRGTATAGGLLKAL